jgi:DNA polymerase IV
MPKWVTLAWFDVTRVIFHLDMDAFYAAIEQRDNPTLRGKPVIVGGPPTRRGVVCAASYEARKYGVRSAMPSATAGRLCPNGIFIPVRMDQYREESRKIMAIVAETGLTIEQVSIDEAYLELPLPAPVPEEGSPIHDRLLYGAVPLAKELKGRIANERGLTASIGIAANKFLAKLASDFQKPDGLTLVPERDKVAFLRPLPVRAIPGVGKVTEQVLAKAGFATIGDLQDREGDLRELAGSFGPTLKQLAFGRDDRPVDTSDEIKSISCEETFEKDTDDRRVLREFLRLSADDIASRLQRRRLAAHTVQVKVRYGDFTTLTRQVSVEEPITDASEVYRLGCYLLARHKLVGRPLRLLGLGVHGLAEPVSRQLTLLQDLAPMAKSRTV